MGRKKAKIAYKKLINSYENGGLKLLDLEYKDISMKVKWAQIDRLKTNSINKMFDLAIPMKKEERWLCNMSSKDIKKLGLDNIYGDILTAWSRINFIIPTSKKQILNETIWFNSHVKDRGKVLFFKKWYKSGIHKINQIINENGNFIPCDQLQLRYGKNIDIINYVILVRSILKDWIEIVKKKIDTEIGKKAIDFLKDDLKCSKKAYEVLRDTNVVDNTIKRAKWEALLDYEISDRFWKDIYHKARKLMNCTKLRFFQYKLLNGYVITNVIRAKWDKTKKISPKCTLCKQEDETILHLLVECLETQKIWKALSKWLNYFCNIDG